MRKKSKEDEQTLEELNLAHRGSHAKCQYKPVTLKELRLFLFLPYNKHFNN